LNSLALQRQVGGPTIPPALKGRNPTPGLRASLKGTAPRGGLEDGDGLPGTEVPGYSNVALPGRGWLSRIAEIGQSRYFIL